MEIEIQTERKINFDFLKYYYFKRNLVGKLIILIPIIFLISYNESFRQDFFWIYFLIVFLVITLLFFSFGFLLPYLISIKRFTKRVNKTSGFVQTNKIFFLPDGINIGQGGEIKFHNWESIKAIEAYYSYACLMLYNKEFYLLSEQAFQKDSDANSFFNIVQSKIGKTAPHNVNRMYNKGWFGLIPLVGAFVGLWLISMSISKYKDRKLFIIGISAVLFTVLVYSSMIYYFQYSEQYRKEISVLSQPIMNTLIKSIEFYKIQNGSYPDSLEELTISDKLVQIYDPILGGKPAINKHLFYYKKAGNRYSLFSSGIDRIPNTKDDIFPSSNLFDSTKTGLIRFNQ